MSESQNQPTAAGKVANKAKDIILEDSKQVSALVKDAVYSRAYLYPIKGIYYFLAHKSLWKPLASKLLPTLTTAAGVTTLMFIFTYVPQAAILTLVNGPLAVVTTILLVLSESATLTNALTRGLFLEEAILETFDGTLLARGDTNLVSQGREVKSGRGSADVIGRLGKVIKKPLARFSPTALLRYIIYLPLNMIPVVGTVIFILLQARRTGKSAHARYFQLKGWNAREQEQYVEKKKAAYTGYGVPAVLLEMVPFVGIGFAFTNAVGAALWAADMEAGASKPQSAQLRDDELEPQETGVVRDGGKKEL